MAWDYIDIHFATEGKLISEYGLVVNNCSGKLKTPINGLGFGLYKEKLKYGLRSFLQNFLLVEHLPIYQLPARP